MEKINYLVNWGKIPQNAWSGTYYSLFTALQGHYNINDINLRLNSWILKIMRKILKLDSTSIDYYGRKLLGIKLCNIKGRTLQFSEVLRDTKSRDTYLYVDNTVSYVNYMREYLPFIYEISGQNMANSIIMSKRQREQDDYLKTCSGIFTMGNWLKDWLVGQGIPTSRIHAVGGGTNVKTSLIAPQPKTHNKILFIGKDFKRKGGYITYEAFKLLRQQGEKVELYVIGPSENPIEDSVDGYHFVGQISFEEEAKYYNMCDVFCMPSYFEAYGLVFVEALTFGLPCIGRNCYEMPYFIQDGNSPEHSNDATGLLLNNDDPRELASLMHRLLHDNSFSRNVLSKRQLYLHEYSWDTVAERIANVIK